MKIPGDSSRELRGSQPCDKTKVKKANTCIDFIIRNNVAREPCSTLCWSDPPGVFWMVLSANLCRLGKPGAWPRWGGNTKPNHRGKLKDLEYLPRGGGDLAGGSRFLSKSNWQVFMWIDLCGPHGCDQDHECKHWDFISTLGRIFYWSWLSKWNEPSWEVTKTLYEGHLAAGEQLQGMIKGPKQRPSGHLLLYFSLLFFFF